MQAYSSQAEWSLSWGEEEAPPATRIYLDYTTFRWSSSTVTSLVFAVTASYIQKHALKNIGRKKGNLHVSPSTFFILLITYCCFFHMKTDTLFVLRMAQNTLFKAYIWNNSVWWHAPKPPRDSFVPVVFAANTSKGTNANTTSYTTQLLIGIISNARKIQTDTWHNYENQFCVSSKHNYSYIQSGVAYFCESW